MNTSESGESDRRSGCSVDQIYVNSLSQEVAIMRRVVLAVSTIVTLLALFVAPAHVVAQGIQTGTIRGHVTDAQDLPVPGVTVAVTSPNLQGARSTVTDEKGLYTLTALPAGSYTLTFELPGFAKIERTTEVLLGLPNEQNAAMRAAGVAEAVQVTAERPTPITSPVVGGNYRHDEVESLATPRTIQGIAQLAPATTTNSPNNTQVVINGAFAFDNVFMINGVDINDNLFAQPQNLFIEDAIEETQVLTSGISAEFGRFSGGVINAITKSGSNRFSGSGRVNFSNPSWTTATPFEETRGQATVDAAHPDTTFRTYEGTFGGPVLRDRLWFFSAGRYQSTANPATLPVTGLVITQDDKNKRGEIKLTGTPVSNHTIQGGYLNNSRTLSNSSGLPNSFLIDPHVVVDRDFPNNYYYTNYRGVLKSTLLVEGQYSQRHFRFGQTGPSGANILDSPFLNLDQSENYNAPYFDVNDPEDRNNRQLTGSATQSWNMAGRHETKGGYEWFRSQRNGGNSQSPTSYVFVSDYVTDAGGAPVLDSGGKPIPMFVPGVSLVQYYPAIKGAELNIDNHSLYVQDHWTITGRLSADIGARFEHVNVASTGGITSIKNDRIVPRLALGYDVRGDGKQVLHVTYGQYSGRYNEAQVAKNSPVGNAPEIDSLYQGPAGVGYDFAPGVNTANYPITQANVTLLSDAKQNVLVDQGMHTPLVHEWSVSYGATLFKNRGYGEVSYIGRVTHSLIEDFQTIPGGVTDVNVNGVSAGDFTNVVYGNSDIAKRNYHGLVFQSRYRIRNNWSVNGHYTLMLKNDGNYEGEEASKPGQPSIIGNYPEAFSADRNYPEGHLQGFQRSRARVWSVYDWKVGRFGTVSVSGLWRVESARVFSLAARNQNPTATQLGIIEATGYPDAAVTQPVFFTGQRGDQFFKGFGLFDASINYNIPVLGSVRPWVKLDLYNLFDNRKLIAWNTTVSQNFANVDSLGLGTTYTKGAAFGTATGNTVTNLNLNNINTYPLAFQGAPAGGRTVRVALGVRF
jgi:Carboxypeptidase regulatory-like domain/Invasin, domain 3